MNTSLVVYGAPQSIELEQLDRGDWFEHHGELFIATEQYRDIDTAHSLRSEVDRTERVVLRVKDGCLIQYDRGLRVCIVDISITQEGYVNVG